MEFLWYFTSMSQLRAASLKVKYIEESRLIEGIKNKDAAIIKEFIQVLNPKLIKMGSAQGYSSENIEEIVQNTWDTFFVKFSNFEGRSKVRTFLYGIYFNKSREFRRNLGREIAVESTEENGPNIFDTDGQWRYAPLTPEKLYVASQVRGAVEDCLNRLPEAQKEVFLLRVVDGENSEVASHVLDVSPTNLRVLLHRAKNALRRCLEKKAVLGDEF